MSVEKLSDMAQDLNVYKYAAGILLNEKFPIWSGSSESHKHHYGKGGLIQHTYEVVDLCMKNNMFFEEIGKGVDKQKLFLAALYHDVGKIWDYEPTNEQFTEWQGTKHKRKIHHISRSGLVWYQYKQDFLDTEDEVLHAILAHHGLREWGSPVSPKSKIAWLLHLCDGLSARIDDCMKLNL